jgi:hypothetical protein
MSKISHRFSKRKQLFSLWFFLTLLIPVDGTWERSLSLALDAVLVALEDCQ